MNEKKRLIINLSACLISFCIILGINFLLTPYITESVGAEAYGYVSLANNFVNYASIITLALNSMASRFVSQCYHKGEKTEANEYFTSILIANISLIILLLIPSITLVIYLNKVIVIPYYLNFYVKILFSLIFINFYVSLINTSYSVAVFIKNRVDLSNLRIMESNIIKTLLMIFLFALFGPNIIFIGIAFLVATTYLLIYNIHYTKKMVPDLKAERKYLNLKKIKTVFVSGIWNTITKLGQVLADGLDLLICNIFVTPLAMGQLAIAKTISSCLGTLNGSLSAVFHPKMQYYYALNNKEAEVNEIKFSMKIGAFFTNILMCGLIVFGINFLNLWIPTQNIEIIYLAMMVTVIGGIVGSSINTLFNVFTVTNKLKLNSLVTLAQGIINVIIVYILLKIGIFPGYEIVIISGVSVTISIIKNLTFTPIYASKCLGVKKTTFYSTIIKGMLSAITLIITNYIVKIIINPQSWTMLILSALICSIIGAIENYFILFGKNERKKIINMKNKNKIED